MPLNRATSERKDSAWLSEKIQHTKSHFYCFWRGKFLFVDDQVATVKRDILLQANNLHKKEMMFANGQIAENLIFLGLNGDEAHFAYDFSSKELIEIEHLFTSIFSQPHDFKDFRATLIYLTAEQGAILGYAKSLLHWHQSSFYCGTCGSETSLEDGGHRKLCKNSTCAKEHFPRTDPVVIMLIEHQPANGAKVCLLAEHQRTPSHIFSTLAGFVDPGESLPEAVIRECYEEAGVIVDDVNYIDSQPWPFPNTLMIGFIASASSSALVIDEEELRSAQWFTAKQLQSFADWGTEGEGCKLPRKESIARKLIDHWCEQQSI